MQRIFVHPYTKKVLEKDSMGNLFCIEGNRHDVFKCYDGCYDFSLVDPKTGPERDYYDKEYSKKEPKALLPEDLKREWFDEMTPWRETLLRSLGDLSKKSILLVGNGETTREIYFAMAGANVIYTDLSLEAVKQRKKQVERSQFSRVGNGSIEFHAVDALHLPFPNDSFDIIYGAAFVHHLDDTNQFFEEVYRCLKINGICRFLDQAYSPVWRSLTQTVLRPLKMYSYWHNPRSPGDLRADVRGGYTKEDIRFLMKKHGFRDMLFKREWFFFRIVTRHYGKLFNYNRRAMVRAKPLFQFMKYIDTQLVNTEFMRKNSLALNWGFTK